MAFRQRITLLSCSLLLTWLSGSPLFAIESHNSLSEPPAVDVQVGQEYPGGTRVRAQSVGVTFIIPKEWHGGMPEGSQAFILGSDLKPGIGLVLLLTKATVDEVASHLGETQTLSPELTFEPTGPVQKKGARIEASYTAGANVGRALALIGPMQNGIIYFLAGPRTEMAYYGQILDDLANSTEFVPFGGRDLPEQWHDLLAGTMLKRTPNASSSESGGMSSSSIWHLCRDGRFSYSQSSNVSIEGSNAARPRSDQAFREGRWRVEMEGSKAKLVLMDDNGTVTTHSLGHDGERTYLDGERVFRLPSSECR